jgi:hypothetical protein
LLVFIGQSATLLAQTPFSDRFTETVLNPGRLSGGVKHRSRSNSVILSWNTNLVGFTLQSSPNLLPGSWALVSEVPTIIGPQYFVTNAIGQQAVFYRLNYN